MAKVSKINLRQLFAKGVKPVQESFYNWFDSYWHKDDLIDIGSVKSLQTVLDKKLDSGAESTLMQAFNDALQTAVQAKWLAVDVYEEYNNKVIKKLSGYIGGSGTPPTAHIGEYYKADGGFTTDKDLAANFKENVTIIEPSQTTFASEEMITGKNIANPAKKQAGKYVNWETGSIDPNPTYQAFVHLPVKGDTDYYFPTLFHIAWYDASGIFISGTNNGGGNVSLKSPTNAKFVSTSFSSGTTDVQIEKGTLATSFEPYSEVQKIVISKLSIEPQQTNFIKEKMIYGKNRFDKTLVTTGKFVNAFSGNLDTNSSYEASDFCDVEGLTKITLTSLIHIAFYDVNKVYISGREYGGDSIVVPENAVWCRASVFNNGLKDIFQIESGENKTVYEAYKVPFPGLVIDKLYLENNSAVTPDTGIKSSIITPSVMYWLSGKEMNIYFDSAIYHPIAEGSNYYSSVLSNRGKFLEHKYRVVPEGDFNFILRTENAKGQLKQKQTDVVVVPQNSGAGQTRKGLFIADSLGNDGRMFLGMKNFFDSDVMNFDWVGTRQTSGIKHEAFGGAGFGDFATAGRITFRFNVPSFTVVKGDVYSIGGSQFTVTEINAGYFTTERTSGSTVPTATGTLTKVYGSGQASIIYSSVEQNVPNKFWNPVTERFDLGKYLADTGQSMTDNDWVFIQLGINDLFGAALLDNSMNVPARISLLKSYLASMITAIHEYNPNIRIGIGQTVPPAISQDATGNLNGSVYSLEYYIKKGLVHWWNALLETYDNTASINSKVYLIALAPVIDRVNNFPMRTESIDSHNTNQIQVQFNDVHPDLWAYLQMSDAYIAIIKNFG